MAVIERRDLSELLESNTLIFENVPDLDGKTTTEDGEPRVWTIRPLTVEREARAEKARMKNTSYVQHVISVQRQRWEAVEKGVEAEESKGWSDEEEDPLVTAEQWGPIVAAMVCEPELDPDDLIENFHGLTLRYIGEEAEGFFRDAPERIKKDLKENRAARRAKR